MWFLISQHLAMDKEVSVCIVTNATITRLKSYSKRFHTEVQDGSEISVPLWVTFPPLSKFFFLMFHSFHHFVCAHTTFLVFPGLPLLRFLFGLDSDSSSVRPAKLSDVKQALGTVSSFKVCLSLCWCMHPLRKRSWSKLLVF